MGNTSLAKPSSYQLLDWLLMEEQCILHRQLCDGICLQCKYSNNVDKSTEIIAELKYIVKSRDPYLYLEDDLVMVRKLVEKLDSMPKEDNNV